jgi:hypothetical protein
MKYAAYLWGIVTLSVIVFLFLIVRVITLGNEIQALDARNSRELAALQDSLKRAQADLATAKELAPGLGEYMTTIQLHAGKLWFAAKALNWELAMEDRMKYAAYLWGHCDAFCDRVSFSHWPTTSLMS